MSYINIIRIIYVVIVKENVIDGIVIVKYNGGTEVKCCEYEPKCEFTGYKKPLLRTAKQHKSIMGFKQSY